MDRKDADIKMACNSIEKHLQVPPLLLQLPVKENGKLVGKSQQVLWLQIVPPFRLFNEIPK